MHQNFLFEWKRKKARMLGLCALLEFCEMTCFDVRHNIGHVVVRTFIYIYICMPCRMCDENAVEKLCVAHNSSFLLSRKIFAFAFVRAFYYNHSGNECVYI